MTVPQEQPVNAAIRPGYDLRASSYGGTLTYEPFGDHTVVRLTGSQTFQLTIDHSPRMSPFRVDGRPLFENEATRGSQPGLQVTMTVYDDEARVRLDSDEEPSFWLEITFVVYP